MTQHKQDLLLELCKPYLLDLLSLIAKSLSYGGGCLPLSEVEAFEEMQDYSFSSEILETVGELTYSERTSVLYEIASWINSAAKQKQLEQSAIAPEKPSSDRS